MCGCSSLLQADLCVNVGGALHRTQRPHFQWTPEPHCSNRQGGDWRSPALHRVRQARVLASSLINTPVHHSESLFPVSPSGTRAAQTSQICTINWGVRSAAEEKKLKWVFVLYVLLLVLLDCFCCEYSFRFVRVRLQAELDVDSDTPGTSTGHRVSPVYCKKTIVDRCKLEMICGSSFNFHLPGIQPEAWCGFGCESMAWSMPRASASNDRLAGFRTLQAACRSLRVSGKTTCNTWNKIINACDISTSTWTVLYLVYSGLSRHHRHSHGPGYGVRDAGRGKLCKPDGVCQRRATHFQQLQSVHAEQEVTGEGELKEAFKKSPVK